MARSRSPSAGEIVILGLLVLSANFFLFVAGTGLCQNPPSSDTFHGRFCEAHGNSVWIAVLIVPSLLVLATGFRWRRRTPLYLVVGVFLVLILGAFAAVVVPNAP